MRKSTKKLVVDIIKDYPNIQQRINERIEYIKHPNFKPDNNVGGGRPKYKNNNWIEHVVITINDDECLHTLEKEKNVIDECLTNTGRDTEIIIRESVMNNRSITELITRGKIFCGVTRAYKLREQFIKEVAKELGIDKL